MKAEQPDWNIEILGINRSTDEAYNSQVVSVRTLPWLQDNKQQNVWTHWQVVWRDVRILDPLNRVSANFNLTEQDLAIAANRLALKQLFLNAAKVVDTDGDKLPDDWETAFFGNLSALATDDSDTDGLSNFTEFAFGTNPTIPGAKPLNTPRVTIIDGQRTIEFPLVRFAGSFLDYSMQTSTDLNAWSPEPLVIVRPQRNRFDGTGAVETVFSLPATLGGPPAGFLRVRAVPRVP